jgi:hypothetical protein
MKKAVQKCRKKYLNCKVYLLQKSSQYLLLSNSTKMYLFQIDEVYLRGILFIVKATFIKCRPVAETRKELQLSFLLFT